MVFEPVVFTSVFLIVFQSLSSVAIISSRLIMEMFVPLQQEIFCALDNHKSSALNPVTLKMNFASHISQEIANTFLLAVS